MWRSALLTRQCVDSIMKLDQKRVDSIMKLDQKSKVKSVLVVPPALHMLSCPYLPNLK